jgi:hypothetical protein
LAAPVNLDRARLREAAWRFALTAGACIAIALAFPFPATKLFLGAVLALVYLRWLETDMGLAVAFAAWSIPVQDLTPTWLLLLFPGANIATVVLLLLILFGLHYRGSSAPEHPPLPIRTPLIFFVVLCLVSIVQGWLLGGNSPWHLLHLFKNHFSTILLMLVAFRSLERPEQRVLVFASVICMDALVSIESVLEYGGGVRERSRGQIGGQPNLYGGFLAMQIPFLLAVAVSPQVNRKIRVIVGAGCVVLLQALFLTGSRGAWVATAASVAILAMIANRRAFVAIGVAYALLPVIAYGFNQTRLESMLRLAAGEEQTESDQSVQYRVEVWKNLGQLVKFPYVWGQGYNTAPQALSRLGISDDQTATHSSIISLLVELGVVGLALYAWIMVGIWKKAYSVLRSPGTVLGHLLAAGFIGAVPALVISDMTGGRFYNGEIMAYFWLLAGVMFREAAEPSAVRIPARSAAAAPLAPGFTTRPRAGVRVQTRPVPATPGKRA